VENQEKRKEHLMNRQILVATVLAASLALVGLVPLVLPGRADAGAEKAVAAKTHEVAMKAGEKFDPATLKIKVGDSVVWVNKDKDTHDATPDKKGDFAPTGDVKPGEKSKPVTFKKAGKFKYVCSYHEDMIGVIEVVE
jgi:plastocyanin